VLLDDLLAPIWARYGLRIQALCAHDNGQPNLFAPGDPLPF